MKETQKTDWNDLHPWIGDLNPDGTVKVDGANYNDWNPNNTDGTHGNGKQIAIEAFSSPRFQGANNNDDVSNRVAYDYPAQKTNWLLLPSDASQCLDTPAIFNQKMKVLKGFLASVYNGNGVAVVNIQATNAWDKTTAPSRHWGNYLDVATNQRALPGLGMVYFDWAHDQAHLDSGLNKTTGDPGQKFHDNIGGYNVAPDHIGTDCVGLSENSASYPNSVYVWNTAQRSYPFPSQGKSVQIVSREDYQLQQADMKNKLKAVIPGDVFFYYDTGTVNGEHVGIVQSNDGTGDLRGIQLVEAYFDGPIAYVDNSRTLSSIEDHCANNGAETWSVVRLK
jgi:hypothetical protein